MNERLREALRRKIASHNRLVWLASVWSALGVMLMWVGFYFIAHWTAALGASVVKGVEAEMPQRVNRVFGVIVLVLLAAGWLARRAGFYDRLRAEKGAGTALVELVLLPARATFGTVLNLRNFLRLDEDDLCAATDLLVKIVRAGKLAASALPQEMAGTPQRERVVHALQLLDLIYLRQTEEDAVYSVADPQRLLRFL